MLLSIVRYLIAVNQNSDKSDTYCRAFKPNTDMKSNQTILEKKFKFNISSYDKRLSQVYCLLKRQKQPTGSRSIIIAPKCSFKPLPEALTSIFRLFFKQIKAYTDKYVFSFSMKTFWTILNN